MIQSPRGQSVADLSTRLAVATAELARVRELATAAEAASDHWEMNCAELDAKLSRQTCAKCGAGGPSEKQLTQAGSGRHSRIPLGLLLVLVLLARHCST